MIAPGHVHRSADAPAVTEPRTERQARERRSVMAPVLHQRAARAEQRRFSGESITGFGALV